MSFCVYVIPGSTFILGFSPCVPATVIATAIPLSLIAVVWHSWFVFFMWTLSCWGKTPPNLNPYWHRYLGIIRPWWCFATIRWLEWFLSPGTLKLGFVLGAVPVVFEGTAWFWILLRNKMVYRIIAVNECFQTNVLNDNKYVSIAHLHRNLWG